MDRPITFTDLAEDARKTSYYVCDETLWLSKHEESNSTPSSQLASEKILNPPNNQNKIPESSYEEIRASRKNLVIDTISSDEKIEKIERSVRKASFNSSCPEIKSLTNIPKIQEEYNTNSFSKLIEIKTAKIYSAKSFGLQRIESRISKKKN